MKQLKYSDGGSPIVNDDFLTLQTNAKNIGQSLYKAAIQENHYEDNIILWGVSATLYSGGTADAYFDIQSGATCLDKELCLVYPTVVPLPFATSLSQLYVSKTIQYNRLKVYKDLSSNYAEEDTIATFGTTGDYQYTSLELYGDCIQPRTYDTELFEVLGGTNYSFNVTVGENTNYADVYTVSVGANPLTGTSYITIPNPAVNKKGLRLYLDFDLSFEPYAPTVIIKQADGTVVKTINKLIGNGNYKGIIILQYKEDEIEIVSETFEGYNNVTPASTWSSSNDTQWTSPAIVSAVYPTKTSTIALGVWNMDTTASIYLSASTTGLVSYTVFNISAMIYNDAQTQQYFTTYGAHGTAESDLYIKNYWVDGTIEIARRTGGIFDGTGFDDATINRGYVLVSHSI